VIVYDAAGNRVIAPKDMDAHAASRLRTAKLRAELATARAAGIKARHEAKQRRGHGQATKPAEVPPHAPDQGDA
jgi:hypothetical protein